MKIKDFVNKIKNKEIDPVENTKKVLKEIKKINKEYFYLLNISEDLALKQAKKIKKNPKGKLAGLPITIKDCICVKDVESRAGSRILENYIPTFNATAVQKLIDEGAIIVGKTSQDEFGFGSFCTNTGIGIKPPLNPVNKERVCGGSSGGSAGVTKKLSLPHVSIAESTGGSIVCPASFCGTIGLCPTYGRVSRYGLMDYANSLDKIGPITTSVEDAALILEVIAGPDKNESPSSDKPVEKYTDSINKSAKDLRIGVIMDSLGKGVDKSVKDRVYNIVKELKNNRVKVEEINLPLTSQYSLSCYYLIAMAEASTNLAKYCGIRYGATQDLKGSFNEFFSEVRSKNFNEESKRRIIIGTFARMAGYRDAYYIRSMKVRTKIIEEYKRLFKKFDLLISPTMPIPPPRFDETKKLSPLQNYMMDILTVGPNLAGLPHLSINISKQELPIGLLIIGDHFQEAKILQLAANIEKMVK